MADLSSILNKIIQLQAKIVKEVQNNDYTHTAFEVYPTDHVIPAGSTEIGDNVWNDNTLTNTYEIPSSMTEEFSLWITKSRLESDIVIDWAMKQQKNYQSLLLQMELIMMGKVMF